MPWSLDTVLGVQQLAETPGLSNFVKLLEINIF